MCAYQVVNVSLGENFTYVLNELFLMLFWLRFLIINPSISSKVVFERNNSTFHMNQIILSMNQVIPLSESSERLIKTKHQTIAKLKNLT